jgi:hypothetical protein
MTNRPTVNHYHSICSLNVWLTLNGIILALKHTTHFCCSFCPDSFDLQVLLPGKLYMPPPQTEDSTTNLKRKRVNIAYRPPKERPALDFRLVEWLKSEHALDPLRAVRPLCFILSDIQRASLVRIQAKKVQSASDIQSLLNETDEWASKWGDKILKVIQQYDRDLAAIKIQDKENRAVQSKRLKK